MESLPCLNESVRMHLRTLTQNVSRVSVPKRYFTVFSTVENRMCKRGYRATFFGTSAIFIRAVPEVFGSVNRPFSHIHVQNFGVFFDMFLPTFSCMASLSTATDYEGHSCEVSCLCFPSLFS